jgi:hypothetical protein
MTILKMTLPLEGRYSIAGCTLLACLNVAYADFSNDVIVDNGADRAAQRTNGNDRSARGGPLHLFPPSFEDHRDGGSGTAGDANRRTSKSHCVSGPKRLCGENR